MDRRQVKSILILFMTIINAALLLLLIGRTLAAKRVSLRAREDLLALLEERGLYIASAALPDESLRAVTLEVTRNPAREAELLETLIGPTEAEDTGGNLIIYRGSGGYAEFRTGGMFRVIPEMPFAIEPGENASRAAERLLLAWGEQLPPKRREGNLLTIAQRVQGLPLWNGEVSFDEQEQGLGEISGRWVLGTPAALTSQQGLSAGMTLLRFSAGLREALTVEDVQLGYVAAAVDPLTVRLTPVWRVSFSEEIRFFNAVTGEEEPASP